jgi:hypothetical protein
MVIVTLPALTFGADATGFVDALLLTVDFTTWVALAVLELLVAATVAVLLLVPQAASNAAPPESANPSAANRNMPRRVKMAGSTDIQILLFKFSQSNKISLSGKYNAHPRSLAYNVVPKS